MSKTRKERAIELRKQGHSYSYIGKKIGLSKATLSYHLSEIPFEPNEQTKRRVADAKLKSAQSKHRKKMRSMKEARKEAKKEVGKLSKRDLFMLGLGLYLGDGNKGCENIGVANSNPKIIKVAAKWFRKICNLKDENFAPRAFIYPDINKEEAINYWADVIEISPKQFNKTYVDRRKDKKKKKKRKLDYGTCHLRTKACNNENLGVKLHRKIMGWIKATLEQI